MEQRIVTTWRRLPVTGDWQRTYAGEEPGMQARAPAAPPPLSESRSRPPRLTHLPNLLSGKAGAWALLCEPPALLQ